MPDIFAVIATVLVIASLCIIPLGVAQAWQIFAHPDNTPYDDE
jgi:hypothetical protein